MTDLISSQPCRGVLPTKLTTAYLDTKIHRPFRNPRFIKPRKLVPNPETDESNPHSDNLIAFFTQKQERPVRRPLGAVI